MEVEATIRLRHARLLTLRKNMGLSQKALCEASGVRMYHLQQLEWLNFAFEGALDIAQDLADFFDVGREEILPERYLGLAVDANRREVCNVEDLRSLQSATKKRFMLPAPDDAAVRRERDKVVCAVIDGLPAREAIAVRLFSKDCTFPEIAKELHAKGETKHCVTAPRAREICRRGMRMLEARLMRDPAFGSFVADKTVRYGWWQTGEVDLTDYAADELHVTMEEENNVEDA